MPHEASLIATLALSLIAALIGALVAARLRLPPVVGYLLGGVLIGPFTSRLVPNAHLAQEIAEVGVKQAPGLAAVDLSEQRNSPLGAVLNPNTRSQDGARHSRPPRLTTKEPSPIRSAAIAMWR